MFHDQNPTENAKKNFKFAISANLKELEHRVKVKVA